MHSVCLCQCDNAYNHSLKQVNVIRQGLSAIQLACLNIYEILNVLMISLTSTKLSICWRNALSVLEICPEILRSLSLSAVMSPVIVSMWHLHESWQNTSSVCYAYFPTMRFYPLFWLIRWNRVFRIALIIVFRAYTVCRFFENLYPIVVCLYAYTTFCIHHACCPLPIYQ